MARFGTLYGIMLVLLLAACETSAPSTAVPTTRAGDAPTILATIPPTSIATAAPTINPTEQPAARVTKLGVHLLLEDLREHWPKAKWREHLRYARDLVGEWGFVIALVRLDDLEPEKWQVFFDECWRLHLTPIIRFATFYDNEHKWWAAPIRDNEGGGYITVAEQYRDFLDHLKWPTDQHYVIVGNEPNRGDEWENQPNGEAYAHFLSDVSTRLRGNDRQIVVLNGALDLYAPHTNGQLFNDGYRYIDADTFINQMAKWDKDIFRKIQVWNAHAYPAGPFREPPEKQIMQFDYLNGARSQRSMAWPNGVYNRGINSYAWELIKLQELGAPPLKVMITETGWRHRESESSEAIDATGAELSAAQVADYFELAFVGNRRFNQYATGGWTPWQADANVIAVIPFALDGYPPDWGHSNWLVLDDEGNVRGVYPQYTRMMELRGK